MNKSSDKSCDEDKPPSEFRFKRQHKHGKKDTLREDLLPHRQRKRVKSRSSRRHKHAKNDPAHNVEHLMPDVAFRESLFDALGDDEGAAFWQGVYGQPIHSYSNTYTDPDTGQTEVMDDDHYAAFVRRKMWEKTREGVEVAREERKRGNIEKNDETADEYPVREPQVDVGSDARDYEVFNMEIDASIQRANQRAARKYWQDRWCKYQKEWGDLAQLRIKREGVSTDTAEQVSLLDELPWPTESGSWRDLNVIQVERFFASVALHNSLDGDVVQTRDTMLKTERVRWHPDKMQQRYGARPVDKQTMESITAVFQIVDNLRKQKDDGRDRSQI